MNDKLDSSINRAVLHALPTSILVLDSNERIILANLAATRLLKTQREYLEGGSFSRFVDPNVRIGSSAQSISFNATFGKINLIAVSKEIIVEEDVVSVMLLRAEQTTGGSSLTQLISGFSTTKEDPFSYICQALVDLEITQFSCVRKTNSNECTILASTTKSNEVFSNSPSIARTIFRDDSAHTELVIIPNSVHGLTSDDISTVDMFISLLKLRVDTQETASDASGSETALALALKSGDMGMAFFDVSRNECYLSDRLATWCSINPETFSGSTSDWLSSFRPDDKDRVSKLFEELGEHKKFKTVVNLETLEQDMRLELTGRPLEQEGTQQWVAIARPFTDEEEVQAAWQTRIAMEESARMEAENLLGAFERILLDTILPTTSDVSIQHSRQDAGTWHVVRPFGTHSSVFAVGAVTAMSRSQAIIDATILTTIADVLASQIKDIDEYIALVRDHARARDIETTIAAVRVINGNISSATHGGASVFISGRSFTGVQNISESTALSLSSHSQATPESVEVASNGRPWRIMTSVIEVASLIQTSQTDKDLVPNSLDLNAEHSQDSKAEFQSSFSTIGNSEDVNLPDSEGQNLFDEGESGNDSRESRLADTIESAQNVMPFRSGSINPNS